jgi:hypothetical protein
MMKGKFITGIIVLFAITVEEIPTAVHYEITASHYEITASRYEFKNGASLRAIMDRIKMAYRDISNNK